MRQTTKADFYKVTGQVIFTSVLGVVMCATPASAETLKQALDAAYRNNPNLDAERSRLRATDESVAIANSGYRPRISANGAINWTNTELSNDTPGVTPQIVGPTGNITAGGINRTAAYGVSVTQPIFNGFQTTNQVRIAKTGVLIGREALRDVERSVLVQAVAAYTDVIATKKVVRLQDQNLALMLKEQTVAKERLAFNELTNTDVAQSKARLANASVLVAAARADVKSALGAYRAVIGHEPGQLVDPPAPRNLPKSLAESLAIADQENPLVVSALHAEESARLSVELIRGRLLPSVSLGANWGEEHNSQGVSNRRTTSVEGRVSAPLYEGGEVHAQVRQAKELHLSQIQMIKAVRSNVGQLVTTAWSQLEATRQRLELNKELIKASRASLDGVRREEKIGQRTLLDVLNAEQELREAQVGAVFGERNYLIASYALLSQIGRLEATLLALGDTVYDPSIHYDEVHRKWFGLTITHSDGHREVVK
jgi:outer membrane protein